MPRKNVILTDNAADIMENFGRGAGAYLSGLILDHAARWKKAYTDLTFLEVKPHSILVACRALQGIEGRPEAGWLAEALRQAGLADNDELVWNLSTGSKEYSKPLLILAAEYALGNKLLRDKLEA